MGLVLSHDVSPPASVGNEADRAASVVQNVVRLLSERRDSVVNVSRGGNHTDEVPARTAECHWGCGRAATQEIELIPGRVGTWLGRKKVLTARRIQVCDYHADLIETDRAEQRNLWSGTQLGMET